jgi:hypothetical protein
MTSDETNGTSDQRDSNGQTEEDVEKVDPSFWMNDSLIVTFFLVHRVTSALYYFSYRNSTCNLHDCNSIQLFKSDESNQPPLGSPLAVSASSPSVTTASASASSLPRYARPVEHPFSRQ